MARVTPAGFVDKWGRRTKAAVEDYRQGIQGVTEAPGQKAAAAQDKMLANITESITSGRWAAKVGAVPLDVWKRAALDKGAVRIASGVDAAMPRMQTMATNLLAAVDDAKSRIAGMPSTSIDDNIARMTTFVRSMHEKKGQI